MEKYETVEKLSLSVLKLRGRDYEHDRKLQKTSFLGLKGNSRVEDGHFLVISYFSIPHSHLGEWLAKFRDFSSKNEDSAAGEEIFSNGIY